MNWECGERGGKKAIHQARKLVYVDAAAFDESISQLKRRFAGSSPRVLGRRMRLIVRDGNGQRSPTSIARMNRGGVQPKLSSATRADGSPPTRLHRLPSSAGQSRLALRAQQGRTKTNDMISPDRTQISFKVGCSTQRKTSYVLGLAEGEQ